MKDEYCKSRIEYVAEAGKNYYTCGYSGEVYIKNRKVVAVLTSGGE